MVKVMFGADLFDLDKADGAFKATEDQTVVHAMVPLVFALVKGGRAVSAEFAHIATLRVGWFGQRRILCVPTLEAMEKLGNSNGCSFTPGRW